MFLKFKPDFFYNDQCTTYFTYFDTFI